MKRALRIPGAPVPYKEPTPPPSRSEPLICVGCNTKKWQDDPDIHTRVCCPERKYVTIEHLMTMFDERGEELAVRYVALNRLGRQYGINESMTRKYLDEQREELRREQSAGRARSG